MWDALYILLGICVGWMAHVVYVNGCEAKKKQWRPLNVRGERLRMFR